MLNLGRIKGLVTVLAALAIAGCGPQGPTRAQADPDNKPDPTKPDPTKPDPTKPDPTKPEPVAFEAHDLDPDEGRTFGGELIVIEGSGFVEGTTVYFGSSKSPNVTVFSPVIIHARSPAHKPGMVDLTLEAPNGAKTVLPDAFLFRDNLAIHSIEPDHGATTGGAPITIKGVGFTAETRVLLGGRLAIDTTVVDSQTILGITPPGARGQVDVIVSTPWTNDVIFDGFQFMHSPRLDTLSPVTGPVSGETIVTLSGSGLIAGSRAYVDGQEIEVTELAADGTAISALITGGAEGPADIQVSTPDGHALLADAFTFTGANSGDTQVLNVWPHDGDVSGSEQVTITAYGLVDVADTVVTFGGNAAQVVVVDLFKNTVTVLAPAGAPGAVDVTVDTANGVSTLQSAYAYLTVPAPSAITPGVGRIDGGDTAQILGANLGGEVEVFIGALPATIVGQTATTIDVITPAGSPGAADVRVVGDGGEGLLSAAFQYQPVNGAEFYAVAPNYGAVAGNTLVKIYGAGFDETTQVRFAKQDQDVLLVSSNELHVRSPKADEPATVDVTVEHDGATTTIFDAYSYFDPYSPYGGSWGPTIRGSVNVTVLDIFTTDPIPQAFVMLWADADTPYQGMTDERGQITFSGDDLKGAQQVTAAKSQHTAMTVVEYDAENVTVHLIPLNPSSPGGGGGGGPAPPIGKVYGQVTGLGKYIIIPPVACDGIEAQGLAGAGGTTNCLSCETDGDCAAGASCVQSFCAEACLTNWDCPGGYICGGTIENKLGCIPDPGEKAAYCQPTNYELWEPSEVPASWTDPERVWVDAGGNYSMDTRLGELAVICVGGVIRDPSDKLGSFVPLRMGVARHIDINPNKLQHNRDIQLSISLNKDVPLRLDGAPLYYKLPNQPQPVKTSSRLRVSWDFGAEGYWTAADMNGLAQDRFDLVNQPDSLEGDLQGVTYIFLAEVTNGFYGVSGTQAHNVKLLEIDRLFSFTDGAWTVQKAGIPRDIHAMWGTSEQSVWAVGADGLIAHGKSGSWFPQFSGVTAHLNAVWGDGDSYALAVGDTGAAVAFDGVKWTVEDTGSDAPLFGVWGTSAENMYAVGQGTALHRGVAGWTPIPGAPSVTLRAVWGLSPTELLAVGDDGRLWRYDALQAAWTSEHLISGIALHGIHGASTDQVWIVGAKGTVFEWSGAGQWIKHDVPTTEQLNAVVALSNGEVFVSGSRGVLLRYDGNGWSAEQAPKYGGDLKAVWAFDAPGSPSFAGGTQVVSLGPMLSFPNIKHPIESLGAGFAYHVDWDAEPSVLPTFNFVQVLAGPGFYFPAWWTVIEAEVEEVTFPNLPEIEGISPLGPFAGSQLLLQVNRVLKPGASVHNFDFWDMYDVSSWKSWSTNGVTFSMSANGGF